jgi:putative hydrolase of the HAD superfamily
MNTDLLTQHAIRTTIDVIAFDADDTLWHNETLYLMTQDKFKQLLLSHHSTERIAQELDETETHNLQYFGYGIKGFTLSMIETAIELTDGRIQGREIQEIINFAKEMLKAPVQPLEHVEEVIAKLSESHALMIITKGDLFDQETKIARSGLASHFKHIEIVSEKTSDTYERILAKYNIDPRRFLMVGNSLRSDILPVLAIGGQAVYVPYHATWAHETVINQGEEQKGYFECEHIGLLPALVERLSST